MDPKTRQLMMLSIPRDLWGPIPGQGSNRINAAFDTGANLLVQTIQADLGIPINHYVEVNFDTFRDISSAVGGVSFYFPTPAKDNYSLLNIPAAGCYSLKGDQALAFVRSRHYEYYQNGYWHFEAESDLARIQRQQAFIKKMIKKAEGEYTNPLALNDILGGITKNLTVDSGFSTGMMLTLAKDFRSMDVESIANVTLPTYAYVTAGGADVLGLQQPQAAATIAAFKAFGAPAPKASGARSSKGATTVPAVTVPPVSVAPSSVNIEVANGSGTSGQAGQASQLLSGLGYQSGVVSSPGYGYGTTQSPLRTRLAERRQTGGRPDLRRRHPGPGPRSDADAVQPRGDHRLQLRRIHDHFRPPSTSTRFERHHGGAGARPPRPCPAPTPRPTCCRGRRPARPHQPAERAAAAVGLGPLDRGQRQGQVLLPHRREADLGLGPISFPLHLQDDAFAPFGVDDRLAGAQAERLGPRAVDRPDLAPPHGRLHDGVATAPVPEPGGRTRGPRSRPGPGCRGSL